MNRDIDHAIRTAQEAVSTLQASLAEAVLSDAPLADLETQLESALRRLSSFQSAKAEQARRDAAVLVQKRAELRATKLRSASRKITKLAELGAEYTAAIKAANVAWRAMREAIADITGTLPSTPLEHLDTSLLTPKALRAACEAENFRIGGGPLDAGAIDLFLPGVQARAYDTPNELAALGERISQAGKALLDRLKASNPEPVNNDERAG